MVLRKGVILFLLIGLTFVGLVFAQDAEGVPENPANKVTENVGEYSENGYPESYEKYIEFSNSLVEREQDQEFWKKSLTGVFAGDPVLGPIVFYTDKFFSFFDPMWEVLFGIEFDWSWEFFLSLICWIALIIVVYYPSQGLFPNITVDILIGVIIASLIGISGAIQEFVGVVGEFADNIWLMIGFIILLVMGFFLYIGIFKKVIKSSEEIDLERSKDKIKSFGKNVGESMDELS
jgi:hypothetical protein|tara:strand:+ start:580 stop:1281 length:702 start_codon:yes stop_codon:yes gene_type:complete